MLLAAGASTRMGTPKQLLPFRGRSLLHHIAQAAIASCCDPIVVVLGSHAEQLKLELDKSLHTVENQQWAAGMGTSIRAGMKELLRLNPNLDAVVITLCDQPFVDAHLLNQLVESYRVTQSLIVASAYANTLGVPALFGRSLFAELGTLNADVGAKYLIQQNSDQVYPVSFPKGAIDLDTPAQYQQLLRDITTGKVPLQSKCKRH